LLPGARRARALVRLARVRSYEMQAEAVELFLEAIDEAGGDRETLAQAHEGVATCLFRLRERLGESIAHAATATALGLELGDAALAAESIGTQLVAETLLGVATTPDTAARALASQDAAKELRVLAQPLFALAVHWWWTDEIERARRTLSELEQRSHELGDESSPPYVLVLLGRVEWLLGELESARARARDGQQQRSSPGRRRSSPTTSRSKAWWKPTSGMPSEPERLRTGLSRVRRRPVAAQPSSSHAKPSGISSSCWALRTLRSPGWRRVSCSSSPSAPSKVICRVRSESSGFARAPSSLELSPPARLRGSSRQIRGIPPFRARAQLPSLELGDQEVTEKHKEEER